MKTQHDTDKKIIALIKMGEKVIDTTTEGHQKQYIAEKKFHDFRISSLSFLTVVFGTTSPFYKEFAKEVTHPTPSRAERALGILTAAQRELQGDWLVSVRTELYLRFELDLLANCRKQLNEGKKLGAIQLATSIFETHLQHFSSQNELDIERMVEGKFTSYTLTQLNSNAYKKGLYERKSNKAIFSWIELRETAESDGVEGIDDEQIRSMLEGMIAFIIKYPTEPPELAERA